ncbi:MAG: hypothetical protein CEE42_03135 [Promethearchaeota archaeon Loki_b31]|nr:MAG: hypothetical protein CEE42_03135 [Candidatus Lokiarchaeota archaeon Loki_b31]
MEKNDEENELGPTEESNNSQETDERGDTNDNSDSSSDTSEQGNESYENLSSESSSTVLTSENKEEMQESDQDELEKEIEKELEEGVEAINKYLEEEAEFINAYQEMVGKAREFDEERESEGEERQKTDEEWEKEVETAAYTAEQLYESMEEIETNTINEEISEIEEENEIEKEAEQSEEISEPQLSDTKEENSKLYEDLDEERDEFEQHQVESAIQKELETEPESIINEKEIEQLQELDVEEQFETVHFNEYMDELVEKQEEDKNIENDKIEQEKENIEQTQEVIHQSTYFQEKLEEQEEELEWDYEEKDEVEQHQVEAEIEEELKTEPKPIINEEELEYIKVLEPEKQLEAELFYEFIEELANKQNEEKEEREENEEQEEISTEQKVAQIMRELDIPQEINTGETEIETDSQEGGLEQEPTFPGEEVVEQLEIEENKDHQQELEEILEQVRKIEQEALNEIEQKEEDLDKTIEKNYERVKRLYKQQTGKRPIYANKETKGFKQWLEQKKKSEEKEKTKQKKELKEEQKKEEDWKTTFKEWIEEASEEECNAELKSELKKALESYNEFEGLTRKFMELYEKSQNEKLSEKEKNILKSLTKRLQELDPIQLELLLSVFFIKNYITEQYWYDFWNTPLVNRVLSKFYKHISQKYKSLKQAQKKRENCEEILKNWIEQTSEEEISLELKEKLKEIVENYNELEKLAIRFMELYKKDQLGQISQSEKSELKSLVKTLESLDPVKIVLLTIIRTIKRYLNDQNFDDFSDKRHINRILNRFFTHILFKCESSKSDTYSTKDLIKDLRNEIQILSEELAQMFPNRLLSKRGNAFGHTFLSRFWGHNQDYVSLYLLKKVTLDLDYVIKEKALLQLQEKFEERLGAKALGCIRILKRYRDHEINTLQFIDLLEKELGRVSGEIKVNNEELGLILAGTHGFIKDIFGRMRQPIHQRYNPNYKFSTERLSEFRDFLFEIFGYRAKKCFENLKRYELLNPDLKEYSKQMHTIGNPHYFQNIEKNSEASYWFGFLRADGSRAGDPYKIYFELSVKDKDRLEEFADAVGFPSERIKFRTRYKWYKGVLKEYKSARIKFHSKLMAKDIDDLGFQSSKAEQKFVPDYVIQALKEAKRISKQTNLDWWLTLPGQVALAFLLGFYDGDGSYGGGRSARIYASSKQFLTHIKELFEIKNKIITAIAPGEDAWAFDQRYVSKGMYSLALGPKLFDMMMNSYEHSMKRKRLQNLVEPLNFLGDQT